MTPPPRMHAGCAAIIVPTPSSQPGEAPCAAATQKLYQVKPGRGIMPIWMRPWSPDMPEQVRGRRFDAQAANQDASRCLTVFLHGCHWLAQIVLAGYKAKKPRLAEARINSAIGNLTQEFKVPLSLMGLLPRYSNKDAGKFKPSGAAEAAGLIVDRLIEDLRAASSRRH